MPGLAVLTRVDLLVAYLLRFCSELLAGEPNGLPLPHDTDQFAGELRTVAATNSAPRATLEAVRRMQREALAELRALGLVPAGSPAAFDEWCWRRFWLTRDAGTAAPGAALLGTLQVHTLLVWQWLRWRASAGGTRQTQELDARLAGQARAQERQLQQTRLETGDVLSLRLALLPLRALLGPRLAGGSTWPLLLPRLDPEVKDVLLRLVARDELLLGIDAALRAGAVAGAFVAVAVPTPLAERIHDNLDHLRLFAGASIGDGTAAPGRLVEVGRSARAEVERFARLHWPGGTAEQGEALRGAVEEQLVGWETRLMGASEIVGARLVNRMLDRTGEWALQWGDVYLPLSGRHRTVVLCCQHLLARLENKGAAVGTTDALLPALGHGEPQVGDMLLVYLALDGLRRSSGAAGWGEWLGRLPEEILRAVRTLAALSPLARLVVPELDGELRQQGTPWTDLGLMLEHPAAEPLRALALESLLAEARRQPESLAGHLGAGLAEVLRSDTLGGAVLTAEFFGALVRQACDRCAQRAASADEDPEEPRWRAALDDFAVLFLDRTRPTAGAVFGLLAGARSLKAALEKRTAAEEPRLGRLRRAWGALEQELARGLTIRPWPAEGQRLLLVCWLNLLLALREAAGAWSPDMGLGVLPCDDPETLVCWLLARLVLSRSDELAEWAEEDGEPVIRREPSAALAVADRLLQESLETLAQRDALRARRLLASSGSPPRYRFDPRQIGAFAARFAGASESTL